MTKLRIDIPPDVIEILGRVGPKTIDEAICQLARSYDAFLEDAGEDGGGGTVQIPLPGDMPSQEDIDAIMEGVTQPEPPGEVVVQKKKGPPMDKDGLISIMYLQKKRILLPEDDVLGVRCQALRTVLTKTPEDLWSSPATITRVDKIYAELVRRKK